MHALTRTGIHAACLLCGPLLLPGIVTLTLATVISLYTILQLSWMHEQFVDDPKTGGRHMIRINRYHQLTQYAFGELHVCVMREHHDRARSPA